MLARDQHNLQKTGGRKRVRRGTMDKSRHSSGDSTTTTTTTAASGSSSCSNSNRDHYLKHLNKISHKISKPQTHSIATTHLKRQPPFDHQISNPEVPSQQAQVQAQPQNQQQQQHQPPVYNINKNDFRDVVQRLTGSPAHERFSTPPPIHPPKPQSSRLQRIRPPPLVQITSRPPPLLNGAAPQSNHNLVPSARAAAGAATAGFGLSQRQLQPLSPLPPFPAVHAAVESPVSAYMRYLQNSMSAIDSDPKRFSSLSPLAPLVSPRWNNLPQPQPHLQQQPPQSQQLQSNRPPSASVSMTSLAFPGPPTSPLPFGCLPSPRSPCPLLSPSFLFSPTAQFGFQQLPLSPTLPVPSPKWKGF